MIFTLLFLAVAAQAFDLHGKILWNDICSNITVLGQSSVILDQGRLSAGITQDGSFTIPDVDPGSYILSVIAHDFAFDTLRVDIPSTEPQVPDVHPYVLGTPHSPPSPVSLPYPISITPRQKAVYFVEPEAFSLLTMFQNPMMLLMAGMGVMVMAMPYLMKNMDPDVMKEVNERQAKLMNVQSSLASGDIRSGLSALLAVSEEDADGAAPAAKKATSAASTRGKGSGRGKRR
ncbi:hypothetical protein BD410DRAFT_781198 [Rickenella mellea]|uniref:ER membrane protein complex subunit 7 beta-sandwich domain-containing protein n=1 Tax=Rickenella mellea TaxID=50990 RepID=A0A4Y7QMS5_9AGAM|nr:hypothetical protein BD410DRAFT_781198 [Rickenella mellea]